MYSILVLEMQKDMVLKGSVLDHGEMQRAIVPNLRKFLDVAREKGVPVIYCNLYWVKGDPLFEKLFADRRHAVPGTPGIEVIDELKPKEGDHVVNIYRMNAFLYTNLDYILRMLNTDTVVITGGTTSGGCLLTAADALQRGFKVILVSDCCADRTEERHQWALDYLKMFKPLVQILTCEEVLRAMKG